MTVATELPIADRPIHATHEVVNQPPPLEDVDLFSTDRVLREGAEREGAAWAFDRLRDLGAAVGRADVLRLGHEANRSTPVLETHDRFGHRIDEVRFHPAWHELMRLGVGAEVHALPWTRPEPGSHVARAVLHFLLTQAEAGIMCPLTMSFAVVPALRLEPEVAAEWVPRVTSRRYDPRSRPAPEKDGCLLGMAMTEKQGGSDVRANSTRAVPAADGAFLLTGHKWFCSAPMCDAFLALAHTDAGLTCFLVPRWRPDGSRNVFLIQRLKDKLGNRSNASGEVELRDTWARRVGEEGRGIRTILEMVNHTRLDCLIGSAGLMRQALVQALHHTAHRQAFGRLLADQPLMRNVLADLALESEAATTLALRVARSYDDATRDEDRTPLRRILTAIGKYWVCKRAPAMIYEAMECHGGNGYVEESVLPRLYREAPVNSIWEGSGNVICLDVLRAMAREPETVPALVGELREARGADRRYDAACDDVERELGDRRDMEGRARRIVGKLARALQAGLLLRHAPGGVADAYCAARLGVDESTDGEYGTLPPGTDVDALVVRALPAA